jgi:hypothetical protein
VWFVFRVADYPNSIRTNSQASETGTTASPLSYILQAAMGQCSTLPAETRSTGTAATASVVSNSKYGDGYGVNSPNGIQYHAQQHNLVAKHQQQEMQEQRHRLRDEGRKESLDFNKIGADQNSPEEPVSENHKYGNKRRNASQNKADNPADSFSESRQENRTPRQGKHGDNRNGIEPMEIDNEEQSSPNQPHRDASAGPAIPALPENAVKIRAYKLNLDSEYVGIQLSSSQRQQLFLGPYQEPTPYLTYSSSEDSSASDRQAAAMSVAIQTAEIFRGITIARDGTILSQNARATRSNRNSGGPKTKRGEKSRQAAKIDQANDLVEESIATGKSPDGSDNPAEMVAIYIVGEYDEMKHLVRDGSKKLRDAEGRPDDVLLAINRPRTTPGSPAKLSTRQSSPLKPSSPSSNSTPRKRSSPTYAAGNRVTSTSPERTPATSPANASMVGTVPSQSAPPKLKGHPRDTRPGSNRRNTNVSGLRFDPTVCNPGVGPTMGDDQDWGHSWNIWNCGAGGGNSQPSSPKDSATAAAVHAHAAATAANAMAAAASGRGSIPSYEGRDNINGTLRDAGVVKRTT